MENMMKSKTLAVSIAVAPETVFAYVSNPANLPHWAPGFCQSIAFQDDEWIVQTAEGPVWIRFAEHNPFGVLDHVVRLASGIEIHNPMRVIPNGPGSEVIFTLFQPANLSEERLAEDMRLVQQDLLSLKRILEAGTPA